MKRLILPVVAFLLLMVPAHALMDNFYFTMPPDSSSCFPVRLPVDLNTLARGYYTLNTTSGFPLNLGYVRTFAEAVNVVKVPLCFYSRGKEEGDFAYYTIRAGALGLYSEFGGGICVSGGRDRESREPREGQNPCGLINGYEDLFYISFLGNVQWALPGTRINYTLLVQSMKPLDLEITFESGLQMTPGKVSVRIPETGRAEPVIVEVRAPNSGEHEIRARARVKLGGEYCGIPFCMMEAKARLIVGEAFGSGFEVFVFPQFLSLEFAKPVPYTIFIENRDQEGSFTVETEPPGGLEADWTRKTLSIRKDERKELSLNITPQIQEAGDYTITFRVSSGGIEKFQEAYLSVRETESDILRRWNLVKGNISEPRREKIEFEVDRFIADYRMKGLDFEDYRRIDALLKDAEQGIETPAEGQPGEPQPLNPLLIAISVLAIILILIFMFYKKSKPFEEGEEW